jgi:hypothetical protein
MRNKEIYNLTENDINLIKGVLDEDYKSEVHQLVSSIQRLNMVKTKSKHKASIYHEYDNIKTEWLNLSHEASELLEGYNNADFTNGYLIKEYYEQERILYIKMKILNEKCKPKKYINREEM